MIKMKLSLLEVFVIAVALGLVARIFVPGSTQARTQRNVSELMDCLAQMRASIDLYRANHKGLLPQVDCFENFEKAMTRCIGCHGPYMDKIPANPFNNLNTVRFDGKPAGANLAGWRLDTKTGLLQADNDAAYEAL